MNKKIGGSAVYCLALSALLSLLPSARASAQSGGSNAVAQSGGTQSVGGKWYAGVEGGVPFGISTFSSFGADKTRAGFDLGVFGGYRFSPVLSLELSAKWGKTSMSARQCCVDACYWLGVDGVRYNAPVLGMEGEDYSDLKSTASLQRYGLRLNVNVLGFFRATRGSRWTVELSPEVEAIRTKATVKTASPQPSPEERELELPGSAKWHFGYGGNLQVGYRLTDNLGLGVYTGLTRVTGSRIDGVPEHLHKDNYLWESGVRLAWTFGGKRQAKAAAEPVVAQAVTEPVAKPETKEEPQPEPQPVQTIESDTVPTDTVAIEEIASDTLPTVYFRFNSVKIPYHELHKVDEIARAMKADADMRIAIEGWCDMYGSKAVNDRISLQRAQSVKRALMRRGISAERIVSVRGNGSDSNQPNAAKARRADSTRKEATR